MVYTGHAQIMDSEQVYGALREPTVDELAGIEVYRATYLAAFGVYPAGNHWVDSVKRLVYLLRPGGIPD